MQPLKPILFCWIKYCSVNCHSFEWKPSLWPAYTYFTSVESFARYKESWCRVYFFNVTTTGIFADTDDLHPHTCNLYYFRWFWLCFSYTSWRAVLLLFPCFSCTWGYLVMFEYLKKGIGTVCFSNFSSRAPHTPLIRDTGGLLKWDMRGG